MINASVKTRPRAATNALRRKVVHITTTHQPTDIRIYKKECHSLAQAGYDVSIIAPGTPPQEAGGIAVFSLPQVKGGRIARMTVSVINAFRMAKRLHADIYHFHDPEFIPAALALKVAGCKVVYDVHEDLPRQILHKRWIPRVLRRPVAAVMEALEAFAARTLDGVVAATPTIAQRFPGRETFLVQNFPLVGELGEASGERAQSVHTSFAYIGGIQEERGAREMVAAIGQVSVRHSPRLELAGEFYPASLQVQLAKEPGWQRVTYHGVLDRQSVANLLQRAAAGLVLFKPLPNHVAAQPNKLFEYMSAGLPVIASDFPLWRDIIAEANCGLLVDPESPGEIAAALEWVGDNRELAFEMGCRGRAAVQTRYNWDSQARRLLSAYDLLLRAEH